MMPCGKRKKTKSDVQSAVEDDWDADDAKYTQEETIYLVLLMTRLNFEVF